MYYFFIHRILPSPDYEYPAVFENWEKLTEKQLNNIKYTNKPVRLEHTNEDIGKVMVEWEGNDKSKMALSYVDDSTSTGRKAIEKLKNGTIKATSPGYEFRLSKTRNSVIIDKEYKEVSLVENPDFSGENGCKILYGAYEADLNIKSAESLRRIEDSKRIGEGEVKSEFTNSIRDIINKKTSNMADLNTNPQQPPAQPPVSQTPIQQQNAPIQTVQQQTPERVAAVKNIETTTDLATALVTDPKLVESLGADDVKKTILALAAEHLDILKKRPLPSEADTASDQKKHRVDVQQPQQQQPQQSPQTQQNASLFGSNEYNNLAKNTTYMAQRKIDKINSMLNDGFGTGNPILDATELKKTLDAMQESIKSDPLNHMVPAMTGAADMIETLVMAHNVQNHYSNTIGRDAVKHTERTLKAGQITDYVNRLNVAKSGPTVGQIQTNQITTTTTTTSNGLTYDTKAWQDNMAKKLLERVSNGAYPTDTFKPEINPVKFDY